MRRHVAATLTVPSGASGAIEDGVQRLCPGMTRENFAKTRQK
jgi:hypothetical protein